MEDIDISVLDNMIEKHVVEDDDAEKNKLLAGLSEAKQELDNLQGPIRDYTFIRNELVCKLYYEFGVSAIALSNLSGLSRQMIHKIVKENDGEKIY